MSFNKINLLGTMLLLTTTSWATKNNPDTLRQINHSEINQLPLTINKTIPGSQSPVGFMVDIHGVINNGVREPYKSYSYVINDFENPELVGENPDDNARPRSLAWSADKTTLYGFKRTDDADDRKLIRYNTSNGVATELSKLKGYNDSVKLQGMAIDENNTCYIVATDNVNHDTISTLYTCDLQTGQLTLVGTQSVSPDIHDIAASCDGKLYGVDTAGEQIVTINKFNGSAEVVGQMDINDDYSVFDIDYDRMHGQLYAMVNYSSGYHTALGQINLSTGDLTYVSENFIYGNYIGSIQTSCADQVETFALNAGFNGSWFNPETNGQGLLFDVLPNSGVLFAAWFTFDEAAAANPQNKSIGSADQRWFTATGTLGDTNSITLDIYNTSGGVFDDPAATNSDVTGSMTITFDDCSTGTVEYEMADTALSGSFPIQRIAGDNVAMCESMLQENSQ